MPILCITLNYLFLLSISSPDTSNDDGVMTVNKKPEANIVQYTFIPTKDGIAHGIVTTFGLKQLYKVCNNL